MPMIEGTIPPGEAVAPAAPLVRRVRHTERRGLGGRWLEVPPGCQAVVTARGAAPQVLPPGRHTLPGVRLWGAPPEVVLAPQGEVSLPCTLPRLVSGDDQPVEATCSAIVRIHDPARLLGERQALTAAELARLVESYAQPLLQPLVRRYTAADLYDSTAVAERLMAALRQPLAEPLAPLGLTLLGLRRATFRPAQTPAEASPAAEPSPETTATASGSAPQAEVAPAAVAEELALSPDARRWQRLSLLFRIAGAALFVITLTAYLLNTAQGDTVQSVRWVGEALGALGTLLLITLFLHSERRARQARRAEVMPPSRLEWLAGRDRRAADRAVRDHLLHELAALEDALLEARKRVYRPGGAAEQQALALQQTIEQVRRLAAAVQSPRNGVPPYLSDDHLSTRDLEAMLAYDHALMAEANALNETARALTAAALAGEDVTPATGQLAVQLAALQHRFAARTRFHQEA